MIGVLCRQYVVHKTHLPYTVLMMIAGPQIPPRRLASFVNSRSPPLRNESCSSNRVQREQTRFLV